MLFNVMPKTICCGLAACALFNFNAAADMHAQADYEAMFSQVSSQLALSSLSNLDESKVNLVVEQEPQFTYSLNQAKSAMAKSDVVKSNTLSEPNLAKPLDGVVLKIGLSVAPPFVIVDNDISAPRGIEVEIIKELQKRTGFEIDGGNVALMGFNEVVDLGRSGNLDICAGGLSLTDERSSFYQFSLPYIHSSTALIVHKNSNISSFADLMNKHVAAENGTTAKDLIPAHLNLKIAIDYTNSNFIGFYRVSRGMSDAIVTDLPLALYYMKQWPEANFKIAQVLPDSNCCMGMLFKKDSAHSEVLCQTMQDMKADGTLEAILNKYVNVEWLSAL